MAADSKTLMDLENNILKLLSESTVLQILDTDDLINVLEDSKKTSSEINERMEEAKVVEIFALADVAANEQATRIGQPSCNERREAICQPII